MELFPQVSVKSGASGIAGSRCSSNVIRVVLTLGSRLHSQAGGEDPSKPRFSLYGYKTPTERGHLFKALVLIGFGEAGE